jgi:hypothetical protein
VLDVELVLLTLRRHVIGEEDVGGLGEFVQDLLSLLGRHVDADASLAAVGVLDERVPVGVQLHAAHVQEPALGVAPHGVLDLDDVSAPVGEDGSRCGHEGELSHLEDTYALHHLDHVSTPNLVVSTALHLLLLL